MWFIALDGGEYHVDVRIDAASHGILGIHASTLLSVIVPLILQSVLCATGKHEIVFHGKDGLYGQHEVEKKHLQQLRTPFAGLH